MAIMSPILITTQVKSINKHNFYSTCHSSLRVDKLRHDMIPFIDKCPDRILEVSTHLILILK